MLVVTYTYAVCCSADMLIAFIVKNLDKPSEYLFLL